MAKGSAQPTGGPLRYIRMGMPILELIAPKLAVNVATYLFLTPFKFKLTAAQRAELPSYERFEFEVSGKHCVGYAKGSGPEILMMHGWMGKALQFRVLVDALVAAGYRCVLVDAPGHGASESGKTNIFEFLEALLLAEKHCSNLKAVMGHSFGAATISLAMSEGHRFPAFISLAAPVISKDILDEFASRINVSEKVIDGIRGKAVSYFNRTFDSVTMQETFHAVDCPVLAIHGTTDLDVPHDHLDVLKEMKPHISTCKIEGIGHRRVLKDERVLKRVIEWLDGLE